MSNPRIHRPEPINTPTSSMARLNERINSFVVRPGGKWVPVIAVDQLPQEIELLGVPREVDPRSLDQEQLCGINWIPPDKISDTRLKLARAVSSPYTPPSAGSVFLPPDAKARGLLSSPLQETVPSPTVSPVIRSAPLQVAPKGLVADVKQDEKISRSLTDDIASIYQSNAQRLNYPRKLLPPSGNEPNPAKKIYCTHWIKTGECAFISQGCLYKHEIPSPEVLRDIGFLRPPKWIQEKRALKPETWMQKRLNQQAEEDATSAATYKPKGIFKEMRKEFDEPPSLLKASPSPPKPQGQVNDLIDLSEDLPVLSSCGDDSGSTSSSFFEDLVEEEDSELDISDTPEALPKRLVKPIQRRRLSSASSSDVGNPYPPKDVAVASLSGDLPVKKNNADTDKKPRPPTPTKPIARSTAKVLDEKVAAKPAQEKKRVGLQASRHAVGTAELLDEKVAVKPAQEKKRVGLQASRHAVRSSNKAPTVSSKQRAPPLEAQIAKLVRVKHSNGRRIAVHGRDTEDLIHRTADVTSGKVDMSPKKSAV